MGDSTKVINFWFFSFIYLYLADVLAWRDKNLNPIPSRVSSGGNWLNDERVHNIIKYGEGPKLRVKLILHWKENKL